MPSVDSLCRIRRLMAEPQDRKTTKKAVLRSIGGRRPQFQRPPRLRDGEQ